MPAWLALFLPSILKLLKEFGIPLVEQKFPFLTPIIDEIIAVLGGQEPSLHLKAAAEKYNAEKSPKA